MDDTYELYHSGKLGMKWGVRNTRKTTTTPSANKKIADTKPKKKSVKDMSDDDLKKIVTRLQMERQYQTLTKTDVSKGKKVLQNMMKAGATVATVTSTGLTIYNNVDKIKALMKDVKK